jgi:hypothetical protein
MNSRFIIIAILISIKVTGIASRAKAEVNFNKYMPGYTVPCERYIDFKGKKVCTSIQKNGWMY